MLTRKEWTRGPGIPPVVKGLVWFRDWSRMMEGTRAMGYWQSLGRRLSISLGKHATVSQAEVYAILDCVNEIQMNVRPEKYVSICSDSQAALNVLQAAKRHRIISLTNTQWDCIGFLDMLGYEATKSPTGSQWTVLFKNLSDLSHPWGSLAKHKKEDRMLGG